MATSDIKKGPLYVDSTNNRVGVGTASPATALDVTGTVTADYLNITAADNAITSKIANTTGANYLQITNGTANGYFGTTGANTVSMLSIGTHPLTFGVDGGTERMRIDSSGNVGVGTASPASYGRLAVMTPTATFGYFGIGNSVGGGGGVNIGSFYGTTKISYIDTVLENGTPSSEQSRLQFATIAGGTLTERMRIDSSGHVGIGTTTLTGSGTPDETDGGTGVRLLNFGFIGIGRDSGVCGQFNRNNDGSILGFLRGGTAVGSISVSSVSTAYNTSSDYRLKENVTADWDATTRLKQLNPVRFNFIADADTTVDGFLAHEVQDVVPEAISGTKDEVDEDGNPVMQGIDQSKLVPLLVKTIIELEARITALEAN